MFKELETQTILDLPEVKILPLTTDSRDAAFDLFNEQKRFHQSKEFKEGLANQLTYYVAEFILRLSLQPFYYQESLGEGKKRLTSPGFADEDMLVSFSEPYQIYEGLALSSVEKVEEMLSQMSTKEARNNRHAAEAKGFYLLREKTFKAENDSFIIFISPPVNPDGYSITYLGQIKSINDKERFIEMVACINHLTLPKHFEFLKYLGQGLNPDLNFSKNPKVRSEDFLLSPAILSPAEAKALGIEQVLDLTLALYSFDPQAPEDVREDFVQARQRLAKVKQEAIVPYLDEFILFLRNAPKEVIDDFLDQMELAAVESYYRQFYQQKYGDLLVENPQNEETLRAFVRSSWQIARQQMPQDGGSCPSTSSDPLRAIKASTEEKDKGKEELHWCPACGGMKPFRGGECVECGYRLF